MPKLKDKKKLHIGIKELKEEISKIRFNKTDTYNILKELEAAGLVTKTSQHRIKIHL